MTEDAGKEDVVAQVTFPRSQQSHSAQTPYLGFFCSLTFRLIDYTLSPSKSRSTEIMGGRWCGWAENIKKPLDFRAAE